LRVVVLVLPNIKRRKQGNEFFYKGVTVFISKNCWNKYLARNWFSAKPVKQFFKSFSKISKLLDWKFYSWQWEKLARFSSKSEKSVTLV